MNRRNAIKFSLLGAGASLSMPLFSSTKKNQEPKLRTSVEQRPLPYAYNALEPHIDAMTMEVHYSKHHAGYTRKFNQALADNNISYTVLPDLFSKISQYPDAVINNGGGYFNHRLFWNFMSPNGGGSPKGELAKAIDVAFGSFDAFKTQFEKAAKTQFGSGWAWLILKEDGSLAVTQTPNQINPLMDLAEVQGKPLLCIDVWEHAYYLKYQNKRADYITAFWNVANWEVSEQRYKMFMNKLS